MSKSTVKSTSIKFAVGGKREMKKDMGLIAISYGTIYVGSLAMGANYN
jgi:pyruvate-ferredoxin/flavodoxin oxidoreductase